MAKSAELIEFSELFEKYYDLVFRLCYRMTGNRSVAEDLAQDVFLKACKAYR